MLALARERVIKPHIKLVDVITYPSKEFIQGVPVQRLQRTDS